jgi:peroxiredoxin
MGTPSALEKSTGAWSLTASHEMFHVLQASRGETQKVAQLKIGSEADPSWQLDFPFPYKDADVMRLIHLQSYPIYLAVTEKDEATSKYNAGTAIEAIRVYRSFLRRQSPDNKFYDYSQFQELAEGIAFYTEYKMAEAAANGDYQPTDAFRKLPNYKSYQQVWEEEYKNRLFLVKHAGRAAKSRTAFYHLGLGKGLLLDRLMPDWKTRYFAPNVWIDDLVMASLGQPSEITALAVGSTTPDFRLPTMTGESLSLNAYRGKVIVLDFCQTWCSPCVEELPHLVSLQEKYRGQGLVVLGIVGKLDPEGEGQLRNLIRDYKINYPILIDEKGSIGGQYNVSGYPHVFVLDKSGRLSYDKSGYQRGNETDLEREILKNL